MLVLMSRLEGLLSLLVSPIRASATLGSPHSQACESTTATPPGQAAMIPKEAQCLRGSLFVTIVLLKIGDASDVPQQSTVLSDVR